MGKKVYILFILLILISCMFLFAQRGLKVVVKTSEGSSLELYKQYRALIIGVSEYLYWPRLPNAVKDAKEVATILRERGFITRMLENPNSDEIKNALDRLVFRDSGAEDGVLIYFAGHGETMKLADGTELGYIIPKDCPLKSKDPIGFSRKAISMEGIQTYSLQLKSKHLLAIFDSCFSGSIFALGRAAPADITYKTALPVRQYITAGSADEIVPDKSIFKECFLAALKGDADANSDQYVTGSELGMYLESTVVNYTRNAQHPQYGKIRNLKLDKGDFVFVLEGVRPGQQQNQFPTKPPGESQFDLSDIKKSAGERENSKLGWDAWQSEMQASFNEVENIDESTIYNTEEKNAAWERFLSTYNEDNLFSTEDEQLRQRAIQRLKALPGVDVAIRARVSLRSVARGLSENEVSNMLKRKNFFSKRHDWNENFCNPYGNFINEYESMVIRGDKVVLDHATGLMWHQSGSDKYMTDDEAKQWIYALNRLGYAGYQDWRLPTVEEAASLLERKKLNGDLYIDPKFSARQRWIWTSDKVNGEGRVWVVNFYHGNVYKYFVVYSRCMRPVRSGEKPVKRAEEALKRWAAPQNKMNSDFQSLEDLGAQMSKEGEIVPISEVDVLPRVVKTSPPTFHRRLLVALVAKVSLRILITENGDVDDVKIVEDFPLHKDVKTAVIKAVKEWKFMPAMKDGKKVKVWKRTTISLESK